MKKQIRLSNIKCITFLFGVFALLQPAIAQKSTVKEDTVKIVIQNSDSLKMQNELLKSNADNLEGHPSEILQTDKYELLQNYPNPCNPSTTIPFYLEETASVKLGVYNLLGQVVVNLVDGITDAGSHSIHWNGMDEIGRRVPGGIYFYRMEIDNWTTTRKMVIIE